MPVTVPLRHCQPLAASSCRSASELELEFGCQYWHCEPDSRCSSRSLRRVPGPCRPGVTRRASASESACPGRHCPGECRMMMPVAQLLAQRRPPPLVANSEVTRWLSHMPLESRHFRKTWICQGHRPQSWQRRRRRRHKFPLPAKGPLCTGRTLADGTMELAPGHTRRALSRGLSSCAQRSYRASVGSSAA